MNKLYCFLSMTLFALTMHAQQQKSNRIIATDYNQCLMGIKDTLGNWIVQPQYIMIRETGSSDFEITDYDHEGIIDCDGRIVVPMIYDRVYACYYRVTSFYTVELKEREGIYDHSGKVIVPCIYKRVMANQDSTFSVRMGWRKWYIFHRDGKRYPVPYKSRWSPQALDSALYISERGRWFLRDKYGLYDDSGNVVARRKYFDINKVYETDYIRIASKEKQGYFTTDLDTIWPMIFDARTAGYRQVNGKFYYFWSRIYDDGVTPEVINNRMGLINMKGDTILPFRYDHAEMIGYSGNHSVWEVILGDQSGIFEAGKGWIIPVSIERLNTVQTYKREPDSSFVGMFTGLVNGKYGMQNTLGTVIVPFDFESISIGTQTIYFINPDSVVIVQLSSLSTRHRLMVGADTISFYPKNYNQRVIRMNYPRLIIPSSGTFAVTEKAPGWKLYYNPAQMHDTLFNPGTGQPVPLNIQLVSDFPNEQLNASVFEVRTLKPQKTFPGNAGTLYRYDSRDHSIEPTVNRFVVYQPYAPEYLMMYTDEVVDTVKSKDHTYYWTDEGLLFREDFTILSNREFYEMAPTISFPDSTVYFEMLSFRSACIMKEDGSFIIPPGKFRELGDFNDHYAWVNSRPYRVRNHWQLVDVKTQDVVYDEGRSWRSHSDLTQRHVIDYSSKTGYFLYDLKTQKKITSGYNQIWQADTADQLFFIRTCTGKHGMMNRAGNIVVDTLYNYYTPYQFFGGQTQNYYWSGNYYGNPVYRYMIMYNDRSYVIYDNLAKSEVKNTKPLVDSALVTVDSLTEELIVVDEYTEQEAPGTIRIYIDSTNRASLVGWHYQTIFDSVFTRKRLEYYDPRYEWSMSAFYSCAYCSKKTKRFLFPEPNDYSESSVYEVHYVSNTVISMSGFSDWGTRRWYTNNIMTPEGVRPLTLQGMFDPNTDWRNYLINSVINYVNSHLNVRGDCHNPAGLPMMLNESFLISEAGLELYPEGFFENDNQLMILLPWSEVQPYLLPAMNTVLPVTK